MGTIEDQIRELILDRYKSIREFTNIIGIPYSTFDSILKRGLCNSNITNVLKITEELGISADALAAGEVISKMESAKRDFNVEPTTIAAHLDTDELTQDELEDVAQYIEFIKNKRK